MAVLDGVRDQVPKRLGDPIGIALGEQIPFCRQLDRLSRMKGFFAGPPHPALVPNSAAGR